MAHLTAERDWRLKGYGHVKYGQGSRFGVSEIVCRQVLVDFVNQRRRWTGTVVTVEASEEAAWNMISFD